MGAYLTNISRDRAAVVRLAAQDSGMAVEYRDYPMPKDYSDSDHEYYDPEGLDLGSVYTHESEWDHSKFWRAYDHHDARRKTLAIMTE